MLCGPYGIAIRRYTIVHPKGWPIRDVSRSRTTEQSLRLMSVLDNEGSRIA